MKVSVVGFPLTLLASSALVFVSSDVLAQAPETRTIQLDEVTV
jgi:hypothetical protein